jgi:hypothetical protein
MAERTVFGSRQAQKSFATGSGLTHPPTYPIAIIYLTPRIRERGSALLRMRPHDVVLNEGQGKPATKRQKPPLLR